MPVIQRRLRRYRPRGLETHESGPFQSLLSSIQSFYDIILEKLPEYFPPKTVTIFPSQSQVFILNIFLQGDLSEFTL